MPGPSRPRRNNSRLKGTDTPNSQLTQCQLVNGFFGLNNFSCLSAIFKRLRGKRMAESNLQSYNEWVQSLKDKGFGGLVDALGLEDYKVKSINKPLKTNLPTQNTTSKNKNGEDAAALPPGCILLPIEVNN